MKTIHLFPFLFLCIILACSACKKSDNHDYNNYKDGVTQGEFIVINNGVVDATVNMEGGDMAVNGSTKVVADVNINNSSSTMTVTGNSEIHRINMKKDTQAKVYFYGSPTIVTDFNVNQGSVIIGDYDHPESTDTIRIKNNFNLYGTLWVNAGVLVIEKELNHFGTIYISNKATVIVNHKWNQSADIYGAKNMICNGYYNHNSGSVFELPDLLK